jgi:hypothetical protein
MDTAGDHAQTRSTDSPEGSGTTADASTGAETQTGPEVGAEAQSDAQQDDPDQPSSDSPAEESTPAAPPAPAEEVEHAYWAEIEEDDSTPEEAELKEIESADGDYSAFECT